MRSVGTDETNFCAQVSGLKALGGGEQWYMLSAVNAHENVHIDHLFLALNAILWSTRTAVRTLSVPATGQSKAQAITQLMSLAAFQTIKNNARTLWDANFVSLAGNDHDPGGATDVAEHAIVDPVGIAICNLRSTKPLWPACASCPY